VPRLCQRTYLVLPAALHARRAACCRAQMRAQLGAAVLGALLPVYMASAFLPGPLWMLSAACAWYEKVLGKCWA